MNHLNKGEYTFRELKQQIGVFCCHFWSKHMPKRSHCQKTGESGPLERVENERSRKIILKTVRATEMHMAVTCVAMGIHQRISICSSGKPSSERLRYQNILQCFRRFHKVFIVWSAIIHYSVSDFPLVFGNCF